jgi:hypothetical protein
MIDCNHIYTLGAERGNSAVLNGKCSICGERAANPMSETLQPFDKMRPGEVDKVFRATCPKCDGRVWIFMGTGTGEQALRDINPDARQCENCGYVHWLRGPNTSEVVPLPHHEPAYPSKKDRVRALVHSLLTGGYDIESRGYIETVSLAARLDREIEDTK